MAEAYGIYKCAVCGNVVSVIEAYEGILVCCGKEMVLLEAKTAEQEGREKHVPVLEINSDKVKVKVGSVEHPMEENHFIELIQILKEGRVVAEKRLSAGQKPEAEFCLDDIEGISARELCTIHGLWSS